MKSCIKKILITFMLMIFIFSGNKSYAKKNANMYRISGKNRVETSIEVSRKVFNKGSKNIVLVDQVDTAGALAAAPLASKLKAPVLLYREVDEKALLKEISRLKAKNILIIGDEKTIPESFIDKTEITGSRRIDKSTKEEMSLEVAKLIDKNYEKAILSSEKGVVDALSAGPLAIKHSIPILFVSDENHSFVKNLNGAVIAGGEASVSKKIEESVGGKVVRLSGKDRFETSDAIAKYTYKGKYKNAIIANGISMADALSASSLSARFDAPIFLTTGGTIPEVKRDLDNAFVVGGKVSVPSIVANKIYRSLN